MAGVETTWDRYFVYEAIFLVPSLSFSPFFLPNPCLELGMRDVVRAKNSSPQLLLHPTSSHLREGDVVLLFDLLCWLFDLYFFASFTFFEIQWMKSLGLFHTLSIFSSSPSCPSPTPTRTLNIHSDQHGHPAGPRERRNSELYFFQMENWKLLSCLLTDHSDGRAVTQLTQA